LLAAVTILLAHKHFVPKAANGEIIAASQGYETKASAEKAIESVKSSASAAKVVDLTDREPAHH
jgi:uncharacterized protein YegP (UPF0339 family)